MRNVETTFLVVDWLMIVFRDSIWNIFPTWSPPTSSHTANRCFVLIFLVQPLFLLALAGICPTHGYVFITSREYFTTLAIVFTYFRWSTIGYNTPDVRAYSQSGCPLVAAWSACCLCTSPRSRCRARRSPHRKPAGRKWCKTDSWVHSKFSTCDGCLLSHVDSSGPVR